MSNITSFEPSSVAIVATTSYPKWYQGKLRSIKHTDKIRGDLALEMAKITQHLGYKIVISDWGSPKTFRKQLNSISGVVLIRRRSEKRSPGKRAALKKASRLADLKVIVLTEPEKVSLVKKCIPAIVEPILKGEADIVVPKRDGRLFKETYPSYQYESETEGNNTYNEELKSHKLIDLDDNFDMFFGPRVLANIKPVVSLFMKRYRFGIAHSLFRKWYFDAEGLSNTIFFPIVTALKKGFKVKSIEVPFKYPALQKQNEDRGLRDLFIEKRKTQRIGLIIELLHFVGFLEKYRGVRVKADI